MTKQPTTTSQAPKNRAGQPQGNAGLLFRPKAIDVKSEYPLPLFSNAFDRAPYVRYCPNITSIEPAFGSGHWSHTIWFNFEVGVEPVSIDEILQQVQDLAEYYATAETELETA